MSGAEFSRIVDIRQTDGKAMHLEASETERAALAERFGLVRIDRLEADLALQREDREVAVTGTMRADFVQSCAVSAEDLPMSVEEALSLRFVPARSDHAPDEEIELDSDDCDEIEYSGSAVDVGEAVAQSLALAVDPFATGTNADAARRDAGLLSPEQSSPFAALKGIDFGKT